MCTFCLLQIFFRHVFGHAVAVDRVQIHHIRRTVIIAFHYKPTNNVSLMYMGVTGVVAWSLAWFVGRLVFLVDYLLVLWHKIQAVFKTT